MKVFKGFTLIELLIVIAVLGVLAATVLVAIDPFEQLARGRDAGRKTAIDQLGKATQVYYTAQTAYPTQDATWIETLKSSGEIKVAPVNPTATTYTPECGGGVAATDSNFYCYKTDTSNAVVYVLAESKSNKAVCGGSTTWIVWSSAEGKTGTLCAEPAAGATGLK